MITNLVYADFENFMKSDDKPTIIDIWAHGCPPCAAIEPILNQMKRKYGEDRLRIGRINVDENEAIAKKFNLRAVPTILFYKNGEFQNQLAVPDPENLRLKIENFVNP